jgi:DUF1680 family protein
MGLKHVRVIYKCCKCCSVKTLEYSASVGQILYLTPKTYFFLEIQLYKSSVVNVLFR